MGSYSGPISKPCHWCGPNEWLLRTERLLSATCMGWCLHASFKEHLKSTTIICAGGASGLYLTNFFLNHLAFGSRNMRLLQAVGVCSLAGVAWCLNLAFEEYPKAAVKACLAGALSFCLIKSVIIDDSSTSLEETPESEPFLEETPMRETSLEETSNSDPYWEERLESIIPKRYSELNYDDGPPLSVIKHAKNFANILNNFCRDFDRRRFRKSRTVKQTFPEKLDVHV